MRTEIFARSFIPSSINLWNNLEDSIRNIPTLSAFKSHLKRTYFRSIEVPSYFSFGDRKISIIHARLRRSCSNLRFHLFQNHLAEDSRCNCGYYMEDVEHFFLNCKLFFNQRQRLLMGTRQFHPLSVSLILFGNPDLTPNENSELFSHIFKFIAETKRFDT